MDRWRVRQVVHFEPDDFVRDGLAHFGFHLRRGRYLAIAHQRHLVGLVERDGTLAWTAGVTAPAAAGLAPAPGVPHLEVALEYPMYADELADGSIIVSNFGTAMVVRLAPDGRSASTFIDGRALGMVDMGNCVVAADGSVWVSEVTGCRVWSFDDRGRRAEVLGDGTAGDLRPDATFETTRFAWIYDLRPGPDGRVYVLDSRHFALRAIDPLSRRVVVVAGTGRPGCSGDGGDACGATFGGDASARFDGPISLALDEHGDAFVGDRWNHRIRAVDRESGTITTIAGREPPDRGRNDGTERDPLRLNLPQISSLDYAAGRLFVPTDLEAGGGDLAVLERGG